jgi:pimeloyl-ACP methyl ester carboxylesterase
MLDETSSGYLPIGGARLYYELSGVGPVVVLIHAGIADSGMWSEQIPALEAYFRVLRYDVRGYGQSELTATWPAYSDHDDLRMLLEHFSIERVHVIGCSMGGGIALDFALAHPQLVDRIVLSGAGVGRLLPPSEALRQGWNQVEAALESGDLELALELENRMWVDGPHRAPDAVAPELRERVQEMNRRVYNNAAALVGEPEELELDPPAAERLSEVTAPVLVTAGELDLPDVLVLVDQLTAQLPNATSVIVPDAGHMLPMEQPAVFNRLVLEFLLES